MAFREVTMTEIREILRRWAAGTPCKRIATELGCDPKTVRGYLRAAQSCGLSPASPDLLSDDVVLRVINAHLQPQTKPRGEAWARCREHQAFIDEKLKAGVRLTKVRKLLKRQGVDVPYSTLHRFAQTELDFGKRALVLPVIDGKPGEELQVDTGWMIHLTPDITGKRRRFRAWIFTPVVSRYRFVYPVLSETTETAIQACEAAWAFYGGVFKVLIPDNTKAIVQTADPLSPTINQAFLEYAQARGFVIDTARARRPKDKARVERTVRDVRDDCFGGEVIATIPDARLLAERWCRDGYGMRRHSTTRRLPREHFEHEERQHLLAAPAAPFDIPTWSDPKVGPDLFCVVQGAFYSLPHELRGQRLRARADSQTVRFYSRRELVRVYARAPAGTQTVTPEDYPDERIRDARRDVDYLARRAREHDERIGAFVDRLLSGPLPWTRIRRVHAVLSMVKKYGPERVGQACALAIAADMDDVKRLQRMVEHASKVEAQPPAKLAPVIPLARYLREPKQYSLPLKRQHHPNPGDEA